MSARHGIEELFALFSQAPTTCALGEVTAVETHAEYGELVDVTLQPSLVPVQARVMRLGVSPAGGAYWPVDVGDACLVLLPGGDHQQAVALVGLNSAAAPPPSSWDNTGPLFVHPAGTTLATSETAVVQAVVLEALLPALQSAMTEISAGLAAFGLPTTQTAALVAQLPTAYRSVGVLSE